MLDLTADPDEIRKTIVESVHSRLPAHAGTPEEMLGIVQAKDLLDAYLRGERPDLRAQMRPAPNVPDTVDALDVLDVIKRSPVHTCRLRWWCCRRDRRCCYSWHDTGSSCDRRQRASARAAQVGEERADRDRLRGWACEIQTQKCRRKLSL
jgi:hypothetical protein